MARGVVKASDKDSGNEEAVMMPSGPMFITSFAPSWAFTRSIYLSHNTIGEVHRNVRRISPVFVSSFVAHTSSR